MTNADNKLVDAALEALRRRLPGGWKALSVRGRSARPDVLVEVRAADGSTGRLVMEAKARLEPRGVDDVAALARKARAESPVVVVSPYLSPSTTERLRSLDIAYLDLTGNVRVVLAKPGLFIESAGATIAPDRKARPSRSLKGPMAGRIVRALVDLKRPLGVRELAARVGVDAGYVSRVLAFLDSEALVTRAGRGRTESVDWAGLLRRWAREAPLDSRGVVRSYLEPRGIKAFLAGLGRLRARYALTGGIAAARFAPIAPPRLAIVWMRPEASTTPPLGLRPADSGANVLLVEPADDLVFEGATEDEGIRYAAPSQIAADLLTSPGRGPAEGEALIEWMKQNEGIWRG